ncbi:MAG: VWA domain-containing protein [Pirellulales bacterium]|nr:VWA domain-containing protein [Pirellulales bacterium]
MNDQQAAWWWKWLLPASEQAGDWVWSWERTASWLPSLLLLVLLFAGGFAAWLYSTEKSAPQLRRGFLWGLRMLAYACLILMLAQWTVLRQRTGLPTLVIVFDDSASMALVEPQTTPAEQSAWKQRIASAGLDQPTRLALAQTLLLEHQGRRWRDLQAHYRPEIYLLSEVMRPVAGDEFGKLANSPVNQSPVPPEKQPPPPDQLPSGADANKTSDPLALLKAVQPVGKTSRLGAGVLQLLEERRGNPPSAIVIFTDGVTTSGPEISAAATTARRQGVPLVTVGVGGATEMQDLALGEITAEEYAFVRDAITLETTVANSGFAPQTVELILSATNSPEPLVQQSVPLPANGQRARVRLTWRPPAVGDYELTLALPVLPGEQRSDNNRRAHVLHVRDQRLRVLLVAGQPSYDYRYLKELWLRENSIELRSHLQSADPDFLETNKAGELITQARLPETAAEFAKFDCVALVDVELELFARGTKNALAEYVAQRGGNVIFLAGQNHWPSDWGNEPLADLLPIDPTAAAWSASGLVRPADPAKDGTLLTLPADAPPSEEFRVQPTELGLGKPFFQLGATVAETQSLWRALQPWTAWLECRQLRPATQVLAVHPTARGPDGQPWPLIMFRLSGSGKVLMHAGDETWRWQARGGQKIFSRYWTQALRYLCRAKLVSRDQPARLLTDKDEYQDGEPVLVEVRFADESLAAGLGELPLTLELPDGTERTVTLLAKQDNPAALLAELTRLPAGEYLARVRDEGRKLNLTAGWRIRPPPGERERTQLNSAELIAAAEQSKGKYYPLAVADKLWEELPPGRPLPAESLPPFPLWNRWPILACALACFILEWWLRKRWGLV